MVTETKIDDQRRRGVEGGSLTGSIGIDGAEIAWRKEFTRFDEADAERLAAMEDTFDRIADDLADEFYAHLESFPESERILGSSTKGKAAVTDPTLLRSALRPRSLRVGL